MAQDQQGYYQVLGLKPGASIAEVKKAYTKKQIECHPDGPVFKAALRKCKTDEEKANLQKEFTEKSAKVNQAKSVLCDEKKKKEYDMGMPSGGFGFDGAGGDIFDIFSQFTGGSRRNQVQKVQDTEYSFSMSFKEAFVGKKASFNVRVQRECATCNGKGGDNVDTCGTCKGKGKVEHHRRLGPLISIQEGVCNTCSGTGLIIKGKLCDNCKGKQYVEVKEHIELDVEPGVKNGKKYIFTGKGNHKKNCVPGDIILIVNVAKDSKYKRIGNNLVCKVDVPLYTALTGGQIIFEHLNGRKLEINIRPFRDFKKSLIVKGEGFRIKNSSMCGDLVLDPNIIIDSNINKEQLAAALNYKPVQNGNLGQAIQKYADFGDIPVESQREREQHSGDFDDAEGFMGGQARDFFGKFGFF